MGQTVASVTSVGQTIANDGEPPSARQRPAVGGVQLVGDGPGVDRGDRGTGLHHVAGDLGHGYAGDRGEQPRGHLRADTAQGVPRGIGL